jgi:hypothetical protein
VHQPENVPQGVCVLRGTLELDKLSVDSVQMFVGFSQEFLKQVVHADDPLLRDATLRHRQWSGTVYGQLLPFCDCAFVAKKILTATLPFNLPDQP